MYTQKIANIFDHIQDHSRLGLENKFLENKSRQIFLRSTGLLYKFLPTNLGVCKPTFYTFYTLHMRWNSPIYRTDLGQNAVFHSFSRQIALSCQPVLISSARCQFGRVFERTLIVTLQHNKEFIIFFFFCYLMVSVITMCDLIKRLIRATFLSTPANDVQERWKQTKRTSD